MPAPVAARGATGVSTGGSGQEASSASTAYVRRTGARSDELEKLLNSWGAQGALAYDAEAMIDELLASTWEVPPVRRGSARATGANGSAAANPSRVESFTQQTRSMNELEAVLADSIDRLVRHRQVISERIASLEKDNQKVTSKFQEGLKNPEQLLNMEDLEERFTKVSSTAVVIGDRLSTLDQERTRVLDTDEMMEALLALNDPQSKLAKSGNRLYNTLQDKNQLHEASRVIKKMLVFSTELSSPLIAVAVNEIERLSQTIENDLLSEFSDAQERENEKVMRKCADSLIEYNDKEKVADRYVWNVMKDRLAKSMETASSAVSSLNPIQDLESLFAKIHAICKEQFVVIDKVFPASTCTSLRELLVERLFNDPAFGIFSYLDQFLNARQQQPPTPSSTGTGGSSNVNPEYVRLLCAAYERTCELAQNIELLEGPRVATGLSSASGVAQVRPSSNLYSPLKEATEPAAQIETTPPVGDQERMRAFLSLQLHSLFGSHRQRYFRTELDLLQRQFREIFAQVRFPPPLVPLKAKAAAKAKTAADKAEKAAATGASASSTSTGAAQSSSSNFERDGTLLPLAPPEVSTVVAYFDSLLTIAQDETVPAKYGDEMMASLERCDIILKDSEMRSELVTKIFSSFGAAYGDEYLAKIAAMANDVLNEPLATPESPKQYFAILEHVLKRIDFIDDKFDELISPKQTDSPTQLTICYESKRKCMEKLERTIAAGLQQVFAVVDKTLAHILATSQDKNDFIGSDANMSLSCSKACKKCIDFLQPLVFTISQVLMAENRDRFLIGLCTIFKDLYLQHLQKFRFDPDGACMLLRDVNAYRQIFSSFRHGAIDDIFDILHEVANIFALPPENLGGFIRDGKLATMGKQSLTDIIKRRWDYKTHVEKLQLQL